MNAVQDTYLYRILIKIVSYTTGIMFHSVHKYFRTKEQLVNAPHPTILMANHVTELDIVALSHVYPHIPERIKFCFAMRQDIIEPDFLIKEFEPKGFIRFILMLIDKSQIIKILLVYVGGIPVKRDFRDDARKLLKQGELRDIVDSQWDQLAEGVQKGRNLFLFPEGKFSETGNLDPIKRGTYFIFKRIPNVSYNYFNFTYDFISENKPVLHIGFGENSHFPQDADEFKVADEIKARLGNNYVITAGNLFSYFILQADVANGISKDILLKRISNFLNKLKETNEYYIAENLLTSELSSLFNKFIEKASSKGFIKIQNETIQSTEKLKTITFRNGKDMRKKNIYLYHKNQLKYYFGSFEKILSEI